jgi:translation initiation factor 2 subunit 1
MLFAKSGFPKDGEIVLCTVTKIQHHSVFVRLDWYDKSGMLHISEISPGRIRNIREFVEEGKVIVCKVLHIDAQKGHIDVSLRRVTEHQRGELITIQKQELKAEKILEVFCHEKKYDVKATYAKVFPLISQQFSYLHQAFSAVMSNQFSLSTISALTPTDVKSLTALILQRIKPPQVEILGQFKITSYVGDGLDIITNTLTHASQIDTKHLVISYSGAGLYSIRIICGDFKQAEKILSDVLAIIEPVFKENKEALYEFTRSEGKQIQ